MGERQNGAHDRQQDQYRQKIFVNKINLYNQFQTVINKVADHDECPDEDDCRVAADKTNLQLPHEAAELHHKMADAVDDAIDKANVKAFPKAVSRQICDRIDD